MEPEIQLRGAVETDGAMLLVWRNDGETVRACRTLRPVPRDEHARWLRATLADPTRRLLLASSDGEPVATCRWYQIGPATWELSWTVAPARRREGIGTAMIRAALASPPGPRSVCQTKAENVPAQKIAVAAGFVCLGEHLGWVYYQYEQR
jgi:RimJ/RimL family protein N-acetyltransferase